jgi:hypothetical protein
MQYTELMKQSTQAAFHGLQLQLATGPQRIGHVGGSKPWRFQGSFGGLAMEKMWNPEIIN